MGSLAFRRAYAVRTLSEAFRAAAYAQETGEVVVGLLTITHEDMSEVLRVSSDPTQRLDGSGQDQPIYGTISRSETFLYIPFELTLPSDVDQSAPAARIRMVNIERDLIPTIRSIATPAQFLIEVVLASDPDTVEITFPTLDLLQVDYDASEITLDLTIDRLTNEPFPKGSFDPSGFPALFS